MPLTTVPDEGKTHTYVGAALPPLTQTYVTQWDKHATVTEHPRSLTMIKGEKESTLRTSSHDNELI